MNAPAKILNRPLFWVVTAFLLRVPSAWLCVIRYSDNLGFLYRGAGLWRGFSAPIPMWMRLAPPATPLVLGWLCYLPAHWIDPAAFLCTATCGALLVFPVGAMCARRGFSPVWGMAAAALLHPLIYTATLFDYQPLFPLALLAGINGLEAGGRSRWLGFFSLAIAALGRAEGALLAPVAAGLIALNADGASAESRNRQRFAMIALAASVAAVAAWGLLFWRQHGIFPYFHYAASNLHMEIDPPAQSRQALLQAAGLQGLPERLGDIAWAALRHIPWWLFSALPGALFFLLPTLPWGWLVLCRRSAGRWWPRDPIPLLMILHFFILLPFWASRHHAAAFLATSLPALGAGMSDLRARLPRLFILAASATLLLSLWRVGRYYSAAESPLPNSPGYERLLAGEPLYMTDDLTLLDQHRERWLGAAKMPLLDSGAPPQQWQAMAREFPELHGAWVHAEVGATGGPPGLPDRCLEYAGGKLCHFPLTGRE